MIKMPKLPISLRSGQSEAEYQQAKLDGNLKLLQDEDSICTFRHWKIIENRFPYDLPYRQCHMLVPKRTFAFRHEMTVEESNELYGIIYKELESSYHQIIENMSASRSILSIFHLHLVLFKHDREEMLL